MDELINMELFEEWCRAKMNEFPSLKAQIIESYELAYNEALDGGSECHEIELAMDHIEQIIEEL